MAEGKTRDSSPNLQFRNVREKNSALGMQGSTSMGYPGGYAGFQDLV